MLRSDKQTWIAMMNQSVVSSEALYVAKYQGLSVAQLDRLRQTVRQVGGQVKVAKNRLMRLALKETNYLPLASLFKGTTVVVYNGRPLEIAKALVDFSKDIESFEVLGGAMGAEVLSIDTIKQYAALPSMDQLRGMLIGLLQAPASKVARVFKAYADKA